MFHSIIIENKVQFLFKTKNKYMSYNKYLKEQHILKIY